MTISYNIQFQYRRLSKKGRLYKQSDFEILELSKLPPLVYANLTNSAACTAISIYSGLFCNKAIPETANPLIINPFQEVRILLSKWGRGLWSDFSIKLTDSLDLDLSLESGWLNNHCFMIFWQNWVNSQIIFTQIWQLFSPRTIWFQNSCHLWICSVFQKDHIIAGPPKNSKLPRQRSCLDFENWKVAAAVVMWLPP